MVLMPDAEGVAHFFDVSLVFGIAREAFDEAKEVDHVVDVPRW